MVITNMKKLYVIRREDVFIAIAKGQLPHGSTVEAGSIWVTVALTDDERNKYTFPIDNY